MPHWHKYGPSDTELESYKVSGWNRPTLSWSLKCEAEGKTREMAYTAAKTDLGRYMGYDTFRKCGIAFCVIFSVAILGNIVLIIDTPELYAA